MLTLVLLLDSAVRLDIALIPLDVLRFTFSVALGFTLPFAVVIAVARVLAVTDIFRVTVALVRATGAVTVAAIATTAVVIAVSTRRQLAGRTTGRGARTATAG